LFMFISVGFLMCVYICGYCNVWVCVCMGFLLCVCMCIIFNIFFNV